MLLAGVQAIGLGAGLGTTGAVGATGAGICTGGVGAVGCAGRSIGVSVLAQSELYGTSWCLQL